MAVNPYESPGEPPGEPFSDLRSSISDASNGPERTDWLAHLITAVFVVPTLIVLILMALSLFLMLAEGMR